MVYFIQCNGPEGPVKIGYVKSIESFAVRMQDFQTANPYVISVLGTIKDSDRVEEHCLHLMFQKYHLRGEWFAFNTELRDYIRKHCIGGGAFWHLKKHKTA